jgi:hypothetical protein
VHVVIAPPPVTAHFPASTGSAAARRLPRADRPADKGHQDDHGWPVLQREQVFVTRAGTTFHTGWCATVVTIADDHPERLLVAHRGSIGRRRQSHDCLLEDFVRLASQSSMATEGEWTADLIRRG